MTRVLFVLLLFCQVIASQARGPYHIQPLSERELLQTYTNLLWDAVQHSDRFWQEWSVDSRAGFWGSGRSDNMNEGIRAISEMVFVSGVLSKYAAKPGSAERKALVGKATAALRYEVASHLTGTQKCTDGKNWGGSWQSAMWTATMAFGAWLMWDELGADVQQDVERVVASEADRFLSVKPPGGSFNDTKAEENGWNMICLSVAVNMFPKHSHAKEWSVKTIEYMVNTLSAPQDAEDHRVVDGRPIADWFSAANLHPDFTLENHNRFHPSYVGCSSYFMTQAAMHYTYGHCKVPAAAQHHLVDVWRMFQIFILPSGESAYPQGMDWELHGTPYINLFASLATWQKDPLAASMERTFLQYMRAWQLMANGDLAVPGSKLGFTRHAICAEQAAYGFLAHKLFGPPVKPLTDAEIAKRTTGVRRYPFVQFITHRTADKFVSMSWTNRLMGMVIPIGPEHEDNPDFIVPIVNGCIGSFELTPRGDNNSVVGEHHESGVEGGDGFETSGTLLLNGGRLKQYVRLISIGQRTVYYEDQVTALTNVTMTQEGGIPIGIENDEVTGNIRTLYYQGSQLQFDARDPAGAPVAIPGAWANVDGRLGIVPLEPGKMAYAQARDYAPGISVKTDVLYGSFQKGRQQFKAGEEIARRTVILYVEVSPKETEALASSLRVTKNDGVRQLQFKVPGGDIATVMSPDIPASK